MQMYPLLTLIAALQMCTGQLPCSGPHCDLMVEPPPDYPPTAQPQKLEEPSSDLQPDTLVKLTRKTVPDEFLYIVPPPEAEDIQGQNGRVSDENGDQFVSGGANPVQMPTLGPLQPSDQG
jgi:hypothetical protein